MAGEKKPTEAKKKTPKKKKSDYPERWTNIVGAFAAALGSDLETVTPVLVGLAGEPGDDALETLASSEYVSDENVKTALGQIDLNVGENLPIGVFKKNLAALRAACAPAAPVAENEPDRAGRARILPTLPGDTPSLLGALRTGGVLKVDDVAVASGVRGSLFNLKGGFEIGGKILALMKKQADKAQAPYTNQYRKMRKKIKRIDGRRTWAEVLSAVGLESDDVTQADRREFLERFETIFWPGVLQFSGVLDAWRSEYDADLGNVANLVRGMSGRNVNADAPDSTLVRGAADALNDAANKTYAGSGCEASRTLVFDAVELTEVASDPAVYALCGYLEAEQFMLEGLGISVSGFDESYEVMLAEYIYGILKLREIPQSSGEEVDYLYELSRYGKKVKSSPVFGTIPGVGGSGTPGFIGRTGGTGPLSDKENGGGRGAQRY
ncbi:MAG: hypothetical protein CMI52_02515 [Parcubacteria group bacterium]|nr:hypothetical protein [Parcubacteria group bacterium]